MTDFTVHTVLFTRSHAVDARNALSSPRAQPSQVLLLFSVKRSSSYEPASLALLEALLVEAVFGAAAAEVAIEVPPFPCMPRRAIAGF
jgi:hypothetical protein